MTGGLYGILVLVILSEDWLVAGRKPRFRSRPSSYSSYSPRSYSSYSSGSLPSSSGSSNDETTDGLPTPALVAILCVIMIPLFICAIWCNIRKCKKEENKREERRNMRQRLKEYERQEAQTAASTQEANIQEGRLHHPRLYADRSDLEKKIDTFCDALKLELKSRLDQLSPKTDTDSAQNSGGPVISQANSETEDKTTAIFGGLGSGHMIRTWNPSDPSRFNVIANMEQGRMYHTASRLPSARILLCGGQDIERHQLNTCQLLNPNTLDLSPGPELPKPRYFHASVVVGRSVFIIGGRNDDERALPSIIRWAESEPAWVAVKKFSELRRWDCASSVHDSCVYIFGGDSIERIPTLRYDPNANSLTELAVPHAKQAACRSAFISGRFYVTGGYECDGNTVQAYDPREGAWSMCSDMKGYRRSHILWESSSKLWALGGVKPDSSRTVEFYEPRMDSWEVVPHLLEHSCTGAAAVSL